MSNTLEENDRIPIRKNKTTPPRPRPPPPPQTKKSIPPKILELSIKKELIDNSKRELSTDSFKPIIKVPPSPLQAFDEPTLQQRPIDSETNNPQCITDRINRDYNRVPIRVTGLFSGEFKDCPIRCVGDGFKNEPALPDVYAGREVPPDACPNTFSFTSTMENQIIHKKNAYHLIGTTDLRSDVPVQYFSWAEYSYMDKPKPKTASAMMAVFISNCGPTKRLDIIKELEKYGVTIHSYGKCLHNTQMPETRDGDYLGIKTRVTSTYKFVFAAENSENNDYVTEKLFGTFDSGSVPVYLGAPNVKKFVPSEKSIISVSDFATVKDLADYLIMLDKNDEKYNEYLKWKEEGPSHDFIAMMDMAIVHSSCRLCIKVGDYYRKIYNNQVGNQLIPKDRKDSIIVNVRARGEFYLKQIELKPNEKNLKHLKKKIKKLYAKTLPEVGSIHSIYRLWDRNKTPLKDEDFTNGVIDLIELEVIFLYPYHTGRGKFNEWQQTHNFFLH